MNKTSQFLLHHFSSTKVIYYDLIKIFIKLKSIQTSRKNLPWEKTQAKQAFCIKSEHTLQPDKMDCYKNKAKQAYKSKLEVNIPLWSSPCSEKRAGRQQKPRAAVWNECAGSPLPQSASGQCWGSRTEALWAETLLHRNKHSREAQCPTLNVFIG